MLIPESKGVRNVSLLVSKQVMVEMEYTYHELL